MSGSCRCWGCSWVVTECREWVRSMSLLRVLSVRGPIWSRGRQWLSIRRGEWEGEFEVTSSDEEVNIFIRIQGVASWM